MRSHERNHRDHYAEITDQILADLDAGTPPWRQPWDNAKADGPCMPQNAAKGRSLPGYQRADTRDVGACIHDG